MDPDSPGPVSVLPLDYDIRGTVNPWETVARIVSVAVVCQGVTLVLPFVSELLLATSRPMWLTLRYGDPFDKVQVLAEAGRCAVGITLAIGGLLAYRRRLGGRRCIVVGEPIAIVLVVIVQTVMALLRYVRLNIAGRGLILVTWNVFPYSTMSIVLPGFVLVVFLRREVRDLFTER